MNGRIVLGFSLSQGTVRLLASCREGALSIILIISQISGAGDAQILFGNRKIREDGHKIIIKL